MHTYIYTYTHTHTHTHMLYIPWFQNLVQITIGCGKVIEIQNIHYKCIISISQIYSICTLHAVYYVQLMKKINNLKNLLLEVDFTPLT
jgi:hypothetical protein